MSQSTSPVSVKGGTARLVEQRTVRRARGEVFAYTADFSNIEQWDPGVVRSEMVTDGPVGIGSLFALEVKFGSGSIPMIYEITRYEPLDLVVLAGTSDKLDAVDEIRFSSRDGSTVIDYTADLTFKNAYRFLGPLLRPALSRVGRDALDGLARVLDG